MEQEAKSELRVLADYLGAVRAVRRTRTLLLWVVILGILSHIGAYCTARWGRQWAEGLSGMWSSDEFPAASRPAATRPGRPAATRPALSPATTKPASPKSAAAAVPTTRPGERIIFIKPRPAAGVAAVPAGMYGEDFLAVFLPVARFAGLAAGVLLILTYLVGINICLGGRMGGICHATSAFFWSIVLVALLFPWRDLVPGTTIELPDAFFGLEQLRQGLDNLPYDALSAVLHYGRFFGCPILALLAGVVSGVRFGMGYRQVRKAVEPLIQMKVV